MSVKNSLMHKKTSSTALWNTIETTYGEIPELIKVVLQINGFDSFLSLRGIRYDDKNEFFRSLETTVEELVNSQNNSIEKDAMLRLLAVDCSSGNIHFKIKPGHRNLIINLMCEIDKVDVEEFFGKSQRKISVENDDDIETITTHKDIAINIQQDTKSNTKTEEILYRIGDHIYTTDDNDSNLEHEYIQTEIMEEYILEEDVDYGENDSKESEFTLKKDDSEMEAPFEVLNVPKKKLKKRRKPDRMYNDEFLSQHSNPRKRRVTMTKIYADDDEGVCERFTDLVKQSMECILSRMQLEQVRNDPIVITKETDYSWLVTCPLCESKTKLSVVVENNGRYRNYKRSNFERHLRFKHCKDISSSHESIMNLQSSTGPYYQ